MFRRMETGDGLYGVGKVHYIARQQFVELFRGYACAFMGVLARVNHSKHSMHGRREEKYV